MSASHLYIPTTVGQMEQIQYPIDVGEVFLAGVMLRPHADIGEIHTPGIVLCHWLPEGRWSDDEQEAFEELGRQVALGTGASVLCFNFRGIGESDGDFGINGWCRDLVSVVDVLSDDPDIGEIWTVGAGVGGSVALNVAAGDPRIAGVVALGAPAEFAALDLGSDEFFARARSSGIIRDPDYPPDLHAWRRELIAYSPIHHVRRIAPRPVLVVHGARDEVVPIGTAERLVDAAGPSTEKVVVPAEHDIYSDESSVEMACTWLRDQFKVS